MSDEVKDDGPEDRGLLDFPVRNTAERLQLALDAEAIVGTWVWNVPADHVTGDARFAESFGITEQQAAQGLPLEQMTASIHPDDRSRVETEIVAALRRGGSYQCEYRVMQREGNYRWFQANGRVEYDSQGQPSRFLGVLLDIQMRRTAEAERDRITELLRTFTAAVPGVVFAKDLEGRMLVANHGTTQLIGKPPEFYLGKTDLEYLADKEQARVIMATDRRIMQGGWSSRLRNRCGWPMVLPRPGCR